MKYAMIQVSSCGECPHHREHYTAAHYTVPDYILGRRHIVSCRYIEGDMPWDVIHPDCPLKEVNKEAP